MRVAGAHSFVREAGQPPSLPCRPQRRGGATFFQYLPAGSLAPAPPPPRSPLPTPHTAPVSSLRLPCRPHHISARARLAPRVNSPACPTAMPPLRVSHVNGLQKHLQVYRCPCCRRLPGPDCGWPPSAAPCTATVLARPADSPPPAATRPRLPPASAAGAAAAVEGDVSPTFT
jgi:hypothetical protein